MFPGGKLFLKVSPSISESPIWKLAYNGVFLGTLEHLILYLSAVKTTLCEGEKLWLTVQVFLLRSQPPTLLHTM